MRFSELARRLPACSYSGDAEITNIAYSSRLVKPGSLFVAVPGFRVDGHVFLADAVINGAAGVVVSREVDIPPNVPWMKVDDSRRSLALLSDIFFGSPSQRLRMIGITGTNGKTTTTFLITSIIRQAGKLTGLMGTVHVEIGDEKLPAVHTTPEAPDLQQTLRLMLDRGLTHAVMEVSSHSIALHRVDAVDFDTAIFTNLTQDHLDYHENMEEYFQAKARLFQSLSDTGHAGKTAIINGDDPWGQRLTALTGVKVITYGLSPSCDIYADNVQSDIGGSVFTLCTPAGQVPLRITTPGKHSVYNALAAAAASLTEECSLEDIRLGLLKATVPGRMEPTQLWQTRDML